MAKQKTGIEQLSMSAFVKMAADRLKAVADAPDGPVSKNSDHIQNRLAAALHPHVQFLNVSEIIGHDPDMKSYVLTPHRCAGTKQLAWFSAGQYLTISVSIDGKTYCRP